MKKHGLEDGFLQPPALEIRRGEEVTIRGCKALTQYECDLIGADMGQYRVLVYGSALCLKDFYNETVVIRGRIANVELIWKAK